MTSTNRLNQTRSTVPQPTVETVARPRVLRLLNQASRHRVTVVTGGPGAGKTLAVADWVRQGRPPGPVAWVTLTSREADSGRLWAAVSAAVTAALGGEVVDRTEPPIVPDPEPANTLLTALGRRQGVLVLDDVQLIEEGDSLVLVEAAVRNPPSGLHLILIARHDPALPLHRLRVGGELGDVRSADLAFTTQEADSLFKARGLQLPEPAVAHLTSITDGWASALCMAAIALADATDPAAAAKSFDGSNSLISDYVMHEVDTMPAALRDLLLATSVVDEISAPLAVALTGDGRAGQLLQELSADNYFMLSGAGWYRLHQLVLQALRVRMLVTSPELVRTHARRAALWFEEQGEGMEALRCAIASRDWDLVGTVALRSALPTAFTSDRGALAALLSRIPPAVAIGRSELRIVLAFGDLDRGDLGNAAAHLKWAAQELPTLPEGRREVAALACHLLLGVLGYSRGDVSAMRNHGILAERVRSTDDAPAGPGWGQLPGLSTSLVAVAELWSARPGAAAELMGWAMTGQGGVSSQGYLALALAAQGKVRSARTKAEAVVGQDVATWSSFHQTGPGWLALALAALRQNDLVAVAQAVTRGEAANAGRSPLIAAGLRLAAAQRRLQLDDLRIARRILAELDAELAGEPRVPWLSALLTRLAVEVELAAGSSQRAGDVLARHDANHPAQAEERFVAPARARLLLATRRPAEVASVLSSELGLGGADSAEAWLLVGLAEDAMRHDASAIDAISQALDHAAADGTRQPFTKWDARLPVLLRRHLQVVGSHREFVTELLAADPVGVGPTPLPGAEPLTERERSVLAFLPTLSSNLEIAEALGISVNTVKQHLKSIHRKLGVSSRRDAVRVAGRLDLLPRGVA